MPGNSSNEPGEGLNTSEILELPRLQREIMLVLIRDSKGTTEGLSASEIAAKCGGTGDLQPALEALLENAYVITADGNGETHFRANLGRKRSGPKNKLWNSVLEEIEDAPPTSKSKPRIDLFKRLE